MTTRAGTCLPNNLARTWGCFAACRACRGFPRSGLWPVLPKQQNQVSRQEPYPILRKSEEHPTLEAPNSSTLNNRTKP